MSVQRNSRPFKLLGLMIAALFAMPALAQFSDSYSFLKAIRDRDGTKVNEYLSGQNPTLINTRDYTSGEGAIHIVVKRRDDLWLRFLLAKGANPDLRDKDGNTPLILAAQIGFPEGTAALLNGSNANVNAINNSGETALIVAVQRRDVLNVRLLLAGGANAKIADHIAGMSARDYAERDARAAAILKLIDDAAKAKPAGNAPVAGPGL
jgi:ankyrin repeat protein